MQAAHPSKKNAEPNWSGGKRALDSPVAKLFLIRLIKNDGG